VIQNVSNPRYHLLDFFRGALILGMVAFHANYLLVHSFSTNMFNAEMVWFWLQTIGVIFFFALSGISFALFAHARPEAFTLLYRKKAFILALVAFLITLITWYISPTDFIWFGIIHFFAFSFFLLPFFHRFGYWNIAIGVLVLLLGFYFATLHFPVAYLFFIGLHPASFWSADYYPLFPYFGYVLFGLCMGKYLLESEKIGLFLGEGVAKNPLTWLGRYSLWVYVLHVPVLYGIFVLCF